MTLRLIAPSLNRMREYVAALETGWSPNNERDVSGEQRLCRGAGVADMRRERSGWSCWWRARSVSAGSSSPASTITRSRDGVIHANGGALVATGLYVARTRLVFNIDLDRRVA
ncbi:MAG TPA: hypothetical protein VND87_15065 [Stellaceae bacterium]|nr:hypothetical protein [Stellaceae bacterium]